jgi:hypothetical protein
MDTDALQPAARKRRRLFQYRLQTLFVVMTLVAILVCVVSNQVASLFADYDREQAIVAEITSRGGVVSRNEDVSPRWLRSLLIGDRKDAGLRVTKVQFISSDPEARPVDGPPTIELLAKLRQLKEVYFIYDGLTAAYVVGGTTADEMHKALPTLYILEEVE